MISNQTILSAAALLVICVSDAAAACHSNIYVRAIQKEPGRFTQFDRTSLRL
jgi:hypothetical protein